MARRFQRVVCSARTSSGRSCRAWAIQGGTVCVTHGGRAPQVKAAAQRRLARERVAAEVRHLGDYDPDNPVDITREFELLLAQDRAEVEVYRRLVGALEPGYRGRTWLDGNGQTTSVELDAGIAGPNHLGDGAPHVLVVQYERARERAARHLKMAHEAGIEERRLVLVEQQGETIASVMQAVVAWFLTELRTGPRDDGAIDVLEAKLPGVVRRELVAVAGGTDERAGG